MTDSSIQQASDTCLLAAPRLKKNSGADDPGVGEGRRKEGEGEERRKEKGERRGKGRKRGKEKERGREK